MSVNDYRKVRQESTGWRDKSLSLRHRDWGYDAPFVDVDYVWIEYDKRKVMGLFDYKRDTVDLPDQSDASLSAIRDMADRGRVPFFVVRYSGDLRHFETNCWSDVAHLGWAAYHQRRLDEYHYVEFLYKLRARVLPLNVAPNLWRDAA